MAITYKAGNRLVGLSSDTKPTADGTLVNNSTFTETNTGKEYILNYGTWREKNKPADNISELLHDHSTPQKQHFWEWFSGGQLDTAFIWKKNNVVGTSTYAMADEVDGGYKITTAVGQWNRGTITFEDKRQYAHDGSVCIGIVKVPGVDSEIYSGLTAGADLSNGAFNYCLYSQAYNQGYKRMVTHNGTSMSETNTGVDDDTAWTLFKLELTASNSQIFINGILRGTNTQYLPLAKMQPAFMTRSRDDPAKTGHIRYIEAYNT